MLYLLIYTTRVDDHVNYLYTYIRYDSKVFKFTLNIASLYGLLILFYQTNKLLLYWLVNI